MPPENTELEAQNLLQLETNQKLESLEQIGEANLVEVSKVKDAIEGLEVILNAIALNTDKQKVEVTIPDRVDLKESVEVAFPDQKEIIDGIKSTNKLLEELLKTQTEKWNVTLTLE